MRVALALLFLAACGPPGTTGTGGGSGGGTGTGGGGAGGGTADAGPDLALTCDAAPPATSFAQVYADVFMPACLGSCHKTGAPDGSESYGLYSTAAKAYESVGKVSLYAGAEKALKIVEANNLGNSALYLKVLARTKSPSGKSLAGAMPLNAAPLNATQKQLLKDWICSGAAP